MATHSWPLPQSSRQQLTLETWRHDEKMIPGILCLLESSPTLHTLLIECVGNPYEELAMTWGPDATRNDLDCDLLNLKSVRLLKLAHPELDGEPMLTMARILLSRATTLEEMVIETEDFTAFSTNFNEMMSQALLHYPKSSEKAVVSFSSVNGRCLKISG